MDQGTGSVPSLRKKGPYDCLGLAHGGNDPVFFADFAVLLTSQAYRKNVILLRKAIGLARAGHDDSHAAVKAIFLVSYVDGIVDKSTQEITFPKL